MFNTYNSYGGPSKVDVKVNEHRAPTDESIRIYDEMKRKALESVLSSGVEELGVDFKWVVMRNEGTRYIDFHYNMVIQGQKVNGKISISPLTLPTNVEAMANVIREKIVKAVSETIANAMTYDLFKRQSSFIINELVYPTL